MNQTPQDPRRLLQLAYRTAARIVHNRALAEEAGERAVHRLVLATMAGRAPNHPEAWIRVVAARTACAILRNGWARVQTIADGDFVREESSREGIPEREELRRMFAAALTSRQREALDAALTHRTIKDAAQGCGMAPRDFRRYLAAIARRARGHLQAADGPEPGPSARWPSTPRAG